MNFGQNVKCPTSFLHGVVSLNALFLRFQRTFAEQFDAVVAADGSHAGRSVPRRACRRRALKCGWILSLVRGTRRPFPQTDQSLQCLQLCHPARRYRTRGATCYRRFYHPWRSGDSLGSGQLPGRRQPRGPRRSR